MQTIPQAKFKNITFFPVPEFSDMNVIWGANKNSYFNRNNLPDVPPKYEDTVQKLFFTGEALPEFDPRVDKEKAYKAVKSLLTSYAPSHEAKITTVAYAMWVWSTKESIDEVEAKTLDKEESK